jgi:hypothetical protein
MSSQTNSNTRTFIANTTITAYARVALAGSGDIQVGLAGDEASAVGIAQHGAVANDPVLVKLIAGGSGTHKVQAAGAITAGNAIYPAASGRVEASGTAVCGWVLETSTTAGDVIEAILSR